MRSGTFWNIRNIFFLIKNQCASELIQVFPDDTATLAQRALQRKVWYDAIGIGMTFDS